MSFFNSSIRTPLRLRSLNSTILPFALLVSGNAWGQQATADEPSEKAPKDDATSEEPALGPSEDEGETPEETGEPEETAAEETEAEADAEPPEVEEPEQPAQEPVPPVETDPVDETDEDDESWMDLKKASEEVEPEERAAKRKMPYFRTMVLVEATVKYGALTIAEPGASLNDDDPEVENLRAGNAAGNVSLGLMPGGRAFMFGGRLRGGSYIGDRATRGNVAAEMFFGGNFGRNLRGTDFTHISGGFGVEFIPGENQDLLTINISGGTVMNGIAFGAGLYGGANDEYAVGMFGMHLGWGRLY